MKKFVEITGKDKGFEKENSWYRFCVKHRVPYITIKSRSKATIVQWDYMSFPPDTDQSLFFMHRVLKERASSIYNRYASKNTRLSVGPGVITFRNLSPTDAREVATELFDLISELVLMASKPPQMLQ